MTRRSELRAVRKAEAGGAGAPRGRGLRALGAGLIAAGLAGAGVLAWRAARAGQEHAAYASAPACDERRAALSDSSTCRLTLRAEVGDVDCLRAETSGGVCEVSVRVPTLEDEDLRRSMLLRREYASLLRPRNDVRVELFRGEPVRIEAAGAMVPRAEPEPRAPSGPAAWAACALALAAGAWLFRQSRSRTPAPGATTP